MGKLLQISIDIAKEYSVDPQIIAYIRSCHKDLSLNRNDMIARQDEKIKWVWKEKDSLKKALDRRREILSRFPNEPTHKSKVDVLEEAINGIEKFKSKRSCIINFLENISDKQFQDIIEKEDKQKATS